MVCVAAFDLHWTTSRTKYGQVCRVGERSAAGLEWDHAVKRGKFWPVILFFLALCNWIRVSGGLGERGG